MFQVRSITKFSMGLAMLAFHSPSFAHHGWSGYDETKPLRIEGVIQKSSYRNPHGTIQIKSKDDKSLKIVLAPTSRMKSRGLTAEMLKAGQMVSIVGYEKTSDPKELRAERITVEDKTVELR